MLRPFAIVIVAFLNAGDVWTVPAGDGVPTTFMSDSARMQDSARAPRRLTRTGGFVEDFRISRDGAYLAYTKRIRKGERHAITSIVVVRLASGTVLTEITPKEGWLDLNEWVGTTLLYHSAEDLEVTGFF